MHGRKSMASTQCKHSFHRPVPRLEGVSINNSGLVHSPSLDPQVDLMWAAEPCIPRLQIEGASFATFPFYTPTILYHYNRPRTIAESWTQLLTADSSWFDRLLSTYIPVSRWYLLTVTTSPSKRAITLSSLCDFIGFPIQRHQNDHSSYSRPSGIDQHPSNLMDRQVRSHSRSSLDLYALLDGCDTSRLN